MHSDSDTAHKAGLFLKRAATASLAPRNRHATAGSSTEREDDKIFVGYAQVAREKNMTEFNKTFRAGMQGDITHVPWLAAPEHRHQKHCPQHSQNAF